jgi:hypothetical protein
MSVKMAETSVYSLGGTKRVILLENGDSLVFEKSPGDKTEFEFIGEDSTCYIYMPPIIKHKCLGCVYSYTIDQRAIRISKCELCLEYITSKRRSVYKMETLLNL